MLNFQRQRMIQAAQFQELYFKYKNNILIGVLVIFYSVGTVGLTTDLREDFLPLSFFNLLLSFVLLLFARYEHSRKLYYFIFIAFFTGMVAEWIGVHTGYLFGNYSYGENLGTKIFGVPLIIGVNWAMLVMISASVASFIPVRWYYQVILASLAMLLLDVLIEPVAIVSDYWTWEGAIPIFNYVTWFVITLFLQFLYFRFKLAEQNKVAVALYVIQLLFFVILNIA